MIKILWECGSLKCCMMHPTTSLAWLKSLSGRDINLPRVPLSHIFTAPEKYPPRREKEALEDESGFDGFNVLASTQCAYYFPILKEKWNHLGDLGFEENWLSVRQRIWETTWKCSQGGVPLMIKIIRWYGLVHFWNGYLAMLLVFIMVTR